MLSGLSGNTGMSASMERTTISYFTVFQIAGRSAMIHNDQATRFEVGDVVLVDAARPATFFAGDPDKSCGSLALNLCPL
jgi:hypothetical protein